MVVERLGRIAEVPYWLDRHHCRCKATPLPAPELTGDNGALEAVGLSEQDAHADS